MFCHYSYFKNIDYKFQPYFCQWWLWIKKHCNIKCKKCFINRFCANKTPVEVIKEGAFGGTYFRDIYSNVNEKWCKKSWKEFDQLKNIDQKYHCSNYYDVNVYKYGVKCGTSLRFW